MPLNVISNFAANVAHRNLQMTDSLATNSLAKLSAGTRVLSAKDDAAGLAVGSRLALDVSGLKQAAVNAGQASSMLQIADGAMSKVNDIMSRMKALAVQAGSGQLSTTDRGMLNTEFQQLMNEVTRIAGSTDFSGTKLVNGSQTLDSTPAGFTVGANVSGIEVSGFDVGTSGTLSTFSLSYATNRQFTLSNGTGGVVLTGSIDNSVVTSNLTNTSVAVKLTAAGGQASLTVNLDAGFTTNSSVATVGISIVGSDTQSFTFKVGTGTVAAEDDITISLGSVTQTALGITGLAVDTTTAADTASDAISAAVDTLSTARANVGALQNRLDFASQNISISIENTEAARSSLMDLDMAGEMSTFVSKQILLQAGVSMLAQANQLPQNLLRLFQ
jgi:flagellin